MKPRLFLPAILSGLLLWASFFPLDLGPLALIALVPWLSLVRAEGVNRWRRYLAAFCGGLAFYLPALQWIRVAHPAMYASWAFMSVYCSAYFVVALFLLRRIDRLTGWPLAFTLPVVWVALDYFRAHFATGFPFLKPVGAYQLMGFGWYMLGYTQHAVTPLIQLASVGGVYMISFLIAAFNGATYEWVVRQAWVRRVLFRWPADHQVGFYREMWVSAAALVSLMIAIAWGTHSLQHPDFAEGPRVSALQGDIPQAVKMDNEVELFSKYMILTQNVARKADLVVWPETCFPYKWYSVAPGAETTASNMKLMLDRRREFEQLAREYWKTNVLVGISCVEFDRDTAWLYNSALFLDSEGHSQGRYDKMHLVPFGEYVPLKSWFPWLQRFTPYHHDYSCRPGENYMKFPLDVGEKHYTFGCLICYEDSDPYLARQYVRSEPVDFLVNLSNDGWFYDTEEHEQHLAICRFRAVEARRSVIRAVNTGISAFIDPDGRVHATPSDNWEKSVTMEGTVTDKVKLDTRTSLYADYGDWLPAVCWAMLFVLDLAARVRRMRAKHA